MMDAKECRNQDFDRENGKIHIYECLVEDLSSSFSLSRISLRKYMAHSIYLRLLDFAWNNWKVFLPLGFWDFLWRLYCAYCFFFMVAYCFFFMGTTQGFNLCIEILTLNSSLSRTSNCSWIKSFP